MFMGDKALIIKSVLEPSTIIIIRPNGSQTVYRARALRIKQVGAQFILSFAMPVGAIAGVSDIISRHPNYSAKAIIKDTNLIVDDYEYLTKKQLEQLNKAVNKSQ